MNKDYGKGYCNATNLSIITVCFNAEKEIEKTIQSVLKQTNTSFEYLIIDGLSRDKTVEIANEYKKQFDSRGIAYRVISEKDNGIYNAMNKGTRLASREWLLFLNAGDYLIDENVIDKINGYTFADLDIVYGDAIEELDVPSKLRRDMKARSLEEIKNGMVFCHQCTFIRRDKLLEFPYDETYRIAGDFNFFYGSYRKGFSFKHIDEKIAVFILGGASSNPVDHIVEDAKIKYTWGTLSREEYAEELKRIDRKKRLLIIREKVKQFVPKSLLYMIQECKYKKLGFREGL
ncbi:MAG: glycosyltransferase family 2 protein [Acetatifactor sp.]